jgi:flavin-dependent dehydrogenase
VSLEVAVIGGGIGGLSAALQLLRVGIDVRVYEQAPRIAEIGAGIQISPNASRLLYRLGLRSTMDAVGVRPLRCIRGAGMMAERYNGRRSVLRSRQNSARPTITSIVPTWLTSWQKPCRRSGCMSATDWSAWSNAGIG